MRRLIVVSLVVAGAVAPGLSTWAAPQSQTAPSGAPAAAPPPPAAPAPTAFDPSKSDEKAIAVVDQVVAAMGGWPTWNNMRYVKLTFVVQQGDKRLASRVHYWDKHGRRSRMEGETREKKPIIAAVDHATKEGQVSVDGQLLFAEDAKKYLTMANDTLINDTYWLFMPFKLKDPGVRLRYEGGVPEGKPVYDKVMVSFDEGIGLTSKDRYWLYVNKQTHLIERWSYVLQGQGQSASPTAWQWEDWTTVGGLKVSTRRTQDGGEVEIKLENVQVFDTLPDTVFTSVGPVEGITTPPAAASAPSAEKPVAP
ncbi:MAG: hypothetical protein ACREAA_16440 [Candidatus Polarisedimenticolia bacterium]